MAFTAATTRLADAPDERITLAKAARVFVAGGVNCDVRTSRMFVVLEDAAAGRTV